MYEGAFYDKFVESGHCVEKFVISKYLNFTSPNWLRKIADRIQYKFNIGPSVFLLNKMLLKKSKLFLPDIIFVYRGKHISANTLFAIKKSCPNTIIFNYNNDDAFSLNYPSYFWRTFKQSIIHYNHVFCYRKKNIHDLYALGYHKTSLLLPYYIKEKNFDTGILYENRKFQVVFIGHYENDGRDDVIKLLVDKGFKIGLFGTGWEHSAHFEFFEKTIGNIKRLNGDTYNDTLNQSKTALVFMSKINNDEYTRRCFEIPPTGAVMLSERTTSMMELFEEGKEILFFDNKKDLARKLTDLFKDEENLKTMSANSTVRILKNGHELTDRINQVIAEYYQLKNS